MSYFQTYKLRENIYQFKDKMGVLATLIIGSNKALLIDTCYGIANLNHHIKTITDKELIVVASHGHMDHTGGNYHFKEVFITKEDIELCKLHNSEKWRKNVLNNALNLGLIDESFDQELFLKQREGNLKELEISTIFDLGDIHVEVINMEGHTKGSIGLLVKEEKVLVVTDATCPWVWMFLPESTTVDTYIKMLERIIKLDFDYIILGHGTGKLVNRNRVNDFLKVAKEIDLNEAEKVEFNNFENTNSYAYSKGVKYNQDDSGIVFDPDKLI